MDGTESADVSAGATLGGLDRTDRPMLVQGQRFLTWAFGSCNVADISAAPLALGTAQNRPMDVSAGQLLAHLDHMESAMNRAMCYSLVLVQGPTLPRAWLVGRGVGLG